MKIVMGVIVGALGVWLYRSERVRKEVGDRFSGAPESLQHVQQSAASATANAAQRVSEVIDSAPVPEQVKGSVSGAAFNVWAAADNLGQSAPNAGRAEGDEPTPRA